MCEAGNLRLQSSVYVPAFFTHPQLRRITPHGLLPPAACPEYLCRSAHGIVIVFSMSWIAASCGARVAGSSFPRVCTAAVARIPVQSSSLATTAAACREGRHLQLAQRLHRLTAHVPVSIGVLELGDDGGRVLREGAGSNKPLNAACARIDRGD